MALESGDYISDLVKTNPVGIDRKTTTDAHLRLLKKCIQQSFNHMSSTCSMSASILNFMVGVTANVNTQLSTTRTILDEVTAGTTTVPNAVLWEGATKTISILSASSGTSGDLWFQHE